MDILPFHIPDLFQCHHSSGNPRHFMQRMARKGADEKVDLVVLAGDIFNFDQWVEGLIAPFKEKGLGMLHNYDIDTTIILLE